MESRIDQNQRPNSSLLGTGSAPVHEALDSWRRRFEALSKPPAEESRMFPMGLVILIACIIAVALAFLLLIDARSDR
ncbi:hypothetical protein GCM10009839_30970 [Catenulispora yoronensis]|uniref:Uncharacterized protein n=1 Tax=Catenulispora yoronensis TaxID=450799 RepID=A0ABN2U5V8_9ACTN